MRKLYFIFLAITMASCGHLDFFEKTAKMPSRQWFYNNTPTFTFNITDTAAFYNLYVVVRHTDAYKYNNLWVKIDMQFPGDTVMSKKIEIPLSNDANGWFGKGMDDIFELRHNISGGPVILKRKGSYTFTLSQIMRENPLNNVLNAGIRVEKINAR